MLSKPPSIPDIKEMTVVLRIDPEHSHSHGVELCVIKSPRNVKTLSVSRAVHIALSTDKAVPSKLLDGTIDQIDDILIANVKPNAFDELVAFDSKSTCAVTNQLTLLKTSGRLIHQEVNQRTEVVTFVDHVPRCPLQQCFE